MNHNLTRSIITAGACIGLGIASQPLLADTDLRWLASRVAETLILSGGAGALTLGVGYVWHQLARWASERPIMPAPSAMWAVAQQVGPRLAGEVAQAQAAERSTGVTDIESQWHNAIVRFAVIGTTRGAFGWAEMRHHVDRPGWDVITRALCHPGVLRVGSGRRATQWSDGWDCPRLRVSLKRNWLTIPPPENGVPVVKW